MKLIFAYLLFVLGIYITIGVMIFSGRLVMPNHELQLAVYCGLCGGVGGVTYCLRSIYLNACVFNRWSEIWRPWYFIRPIVSFICGVVSFLFLKAGLIVLEAKQTTSSTYLAYYALAFIAGLNVDKFIEKIENIAQVTWGIKKSRTARRDEDNGST